MPVCPQCGSQRIDRYCAQCGSVAAQASPRPMARRPAGPTNKASGRGVAFAALVLFFGLGAMYFMAHSSVPTPLSVPATISESYDSRSLRQLANEVTGRVSAGRAGVDALESRILSLRSDLDRWSVERDEAVSVRQRLLQSLRQAEYEGRWPTKAAGRSVDREGLKEMIGRADQWMQQYGVVAAATEAKVAKISIAAGQADKLLLAMQRIGAEANAYGVTRESGADQAYLRDQRSKLLQLGVQLDLIVRDRSLLGDGWQLGPLNLESSGR
jgi:hypothetical protein